MAVSDMCSAERNCDIRTSEPFPPSPQATVVPHEGMAEGTHYYVSVLHRSELIRATNGPRRSPFGDIAFRGMRAVEKNQQGVNLACMSGIRL